MPHHVQGRVDRIYLIFAGRIRAGAGGSIRTGQDFDRGGASPAPISMGIK